MWLALGHTVCNWNFSNVHEKKLWKRGQTDVVLLPPGVWAGNPYRLVVVWRGGRPKLHLTGCQGCVSWCITSAPLVTNQQPAGCRCRRFASSPGSPGKLASMTHCISKNLQQKSKAYPQISAVEFQLVCYWFGHGFGCRLAPFQRDKYCV